MASAWLPTLLSLASTFGAQEAPPPLFNGVDLTGWSGDSTHWTVEDGCIVGRSTAENPLERSIYLFSEVEASDFELTFDYRIVGGNSGVQYRSLRLENDDVAGYQADIEDGPHYSGILYESAGRAIMASRGQTLHFLPDGSRSEGPALGEASGLQAAIREHEWNHYRIVADGPLLVHEINGVKMVEV
ncbi:MAG: 3-keto-disaccharide hydrolase, partial [Planctomycetota bacterium]